MAPKLRLALLGCGRICQVHWNGIQESALDLVHIAVCIDIHLPRAESMAEKLERLTGEPCSAFVSLAEALSSGVVFDAVDIMLLHSQHEAAALEAFAAGLHVLLEKPMSISPESCGKIMAASAASDKVFWVAEQEQYAPAILTAQRLIAEGAIGETVTLHTMGAGGERRKGAGVGDAPVKTDPSGKAVDQGAVVKAAGLPSYSSVLEGEAKFRDPQKLNMAWRGDVSVSGGGVIIDGGSHTIRPMRMLMAPHCGNVAAVAAVTEAFNPNSEGENFTRTLMRFDNGRVATLEMGGVPGALYGPEPWKHRVLGTEGELRVVNSSAGNVEPDVVVYSNDSPEGKVYEHPEYKEHHGLLIADFAQTVLNGPDAMQGVDAGDSLGESLTAMAIYRANSTREWQEVFVKEAIGSMAIEGQVEALAPRL